MKMNKRNPVGDGRAEAPDYGKMIIELVPEIGNQKFLKRIYVSMREYIKERPE